MKNETNIYKIAYKLVTSLDYNNPDLSVEKSTKVIQRNLKAENAVLFKKNKDEKFDVVSYSNEKYLDELKGIVNIYNKKRKRDLDVALDDENIKRLMILNIPIDEEIYALVVINGLSLNDNKESINVIKKSFRNIIINSELIYKLKLVGVTDVLTNLKNRSGYEQDKRAFLEQDEKKVTYIIFDLFRLKHINDTYGHTKGDKYISETAKILSKVFSAKETSIYRLGGDEFAVISSNVDLDSIEEKINSAKEMLNNVSLGKNINDILMLNHGISCGSSHKIEKLYKYADNELSSNKEETYKTLKIERRR